MGKIIAHNRFRLQLVRDMLGLSHNARFLVLHIVFY